MTQKYFVTITAYGEGQLANAAALGIPLQLTAMAVGDAGGVEPQPSRTQTQLINETYRAQINSLSVDENNINQVIAELVIPETVGGWFVREVGLYDHAGYLFAVANCPPSYKPQMAEGSGRTQVIRIVMVVSSADNITLKIDPAVVIATRNYVDQKFKGRKVKAGTGLDGGGDLSSDVTLNVRYGTTADTAAEGDDLRIKGALQVSSLADGVGDSDKTAMSQKAATESFVEKTSLKTAAYFDVSETNTDSTPGRILRTGDSGLQSNVAPEISASTMDDPRPSGIYSIPSTTGSAFSESGSLINFSTVGSKFRSQLFTGFLSPSLKLRQRNADGLWGDVVTFFSNQNLFNIGATRESARLAIGVRDGVGIGQTWQNMTLSRMKNVTYTNPEDQPIEVLILRADGGSGDSLIIDDVEMIGAAGAVAGYSLLNFTVPAGKEYLYTNSTSAGFTRWMELKS